ncbi:ScbA/BarX family gamma-butyrolactone biosynthesis protein [Streptomyces sp. SID5910]|uniref:ScbA/BarX family gamma-butyrolactone biosynthesis protein n=1 Tax=Streptomyces sp. SID5910 TaxID=2690312 RepID=UPI00136989DD|nr:ScbA/BarX family gamma-butyrolactone biosynthesis protein [Streptomyces sp. SID5910]MYR41026.1 gamma-butyrolactone biosynthesis protein [Streptomyces sp. SID5910]
MSVTLRSLTAVGGDARRTPPTVPRESVHRHSSSEVFLGSAVPGPDGSFTARAVLPWAHPYWTDHARPRAADPLLLLECCRQAETYAAHEYFGVPADTKFVLVDWSLALEPAAGEPVPAGAELVIEATTHDAERRGDALRALAYRMRLSVNGAPAGEVRMRVRYVPDAVYRAMRARRDGSALPSSREYGGRPDGVPAPPAEVARKSADNVVLLDVRTDGDAVRARMRVAGDHPSLFDHAQDHVPGMVLLEAGRQAALVALARFGGHPAADWRMGGLRAEFSAYAELDAPLTVTAHRPEPADGTNGALGVRVTFAQNGRTPAEASFTAGTAPTSPPGADGDAAARA